MAGQEIMATLLWIILIFTNFHYSYAFVSDQFPEEKSFLNKILNTSSQIINSLNVFYSEENMQPWILKVTNMSQDNVQKPEKIIEMIFYISCKHEWLSLGKEFITDQVTQMVKNTSDILLELNFALVLKHIVIPENNECVIPLNSTSMTANFDHLDNFTQKNEKILTGYDVMAFLLPANYYIESDSETDKSIGIASLNSVCYFSAPAPILFVGNNSSIGRYFTLAHEIGHTIGLEHDDQTIEGDCHYDQCIMIPRMPEISTNEMRIGFSQKSKNRLKEVLEVYDFNCTYEKMEKEDHKYCGNGIVEDDEECDCFTRVNCSNCCDRSTCTLVNHANCTSGYCCNLNTCSVHNDNFICRPSIDDCDIEEQCDGKSTECPKDFVFSNGELCDDGNGHCANGKCGSYRLACDVLFYNTAPGNDSCYQFNERGNLYGNCGPLPGKSFVDSFFTRYIQCKTENAKCGSLWCVRGSSLKRIFHSSRAVSYKNCTTQSFQYLPQGLSMDLGHVPDGSPCEPNKMCMKQKCVPISSVVGCQDFKCQMHEIFFEFLLQVTLICVTMIKFIWRIIKPFLMKYQGVDDKEVIPS